MNKQLIHQQNKFDKKEFPITLICDLLKSPANIGGLFRVADSFGVEQIYFCGEDITVVSNRMRRTARAAHQIIPYHQESDIMSAIEELVSKGYSILVLEITENSIPISQYKPQTDEKIALIIGEENYGVSEKVISVADQVVHIEMFGTNSSMNVVTATGIALYELTKRYS